MCAAFRWCSCVAVERFDWSGREMEGWLQVVRLAADCVFQCCCPDLLSVVVEAEWCSVHRSVVMLVNVRLISRP